MGIKNVVGDLRLNGSPVLTQEDAFLEFNEDDGEYWTKGTKDDQHDIINTHLMTIKSDSEVIFESGISVGENDEIILTKDGIVLNAPLSSGGGNLCIQGDSMYLEQMWAGPGDEVYISKDGVFVSGDSTIELGGERVVTEDKTLGLYNEDGKYHTKGGENGVPDRIVAYQLEIDTDEQVRVDGGVICGHNKLCDMSSRGIYIADNNEEEEFCETEVVLSQSGLHIYSSGNTAPVISLANETAVTAGISTSGTPHLYVEDQNDYIRANHHGAYIGIDDATGTGDFGSDEVQHYRLTYPLKSGTIAVGEDLDVKLDANGWTNVENGWSNGDSYIKPGEIYLGGGDSGINNKISSTGVDGFYYGARYKLNNEGLSLTDSSDNSVKVDVNSITKQITEFVGTDNGPVLETTNLEFSFPTASGTFATQEYVNEIVGDISSALDELLSYAQSFIEGEQI